MSAKLLQCTFLWYGWTNQSIHYMVFCRQKYTWSKSENVYTALYMNKLESIMRALSDTLPAGHRAMASPTLQLHFGCGRATPPVSHYHNWPSGCNIFGQNFTKKVIVCQKRPENQFWRLHDTTEAYIVVKMPVFEKKNGQFEGDIIFCHLN